MISLHIQGLIIALVGQACTNTGVWVMICCRLIKPPLRIIHNSQIWQLIFGSCMLALSFFLKFKMIFDVNRSFQSNQRWTMDSTHGYFMSYLFFFFSILWFLGIDTYQLSVRGQNDTTYSLGIYVPVIYIRDWVSLAVLYRKLLEFNSDLQAKLLHYRTLCDQICDTLNVPFHFKLKRHLPPTLADTEIMVQWELKSK